jgi:iron complex outermembrane recepter protein
MFDLPFAPGARWLGATAITAALCATAAQARPARQADYALPAQELSLSLREVSLRSGTSVIAPSELVSGKQAPPLKGRYGPHRALELLLGGSGLRALMVGDALVVSRAAGPVEAGSPAAAPQPEGTETITVTGTRIRGSGSASQVTVTTRRELEQAGINDLAEYTRILPQNYTGGQNRGIAGGGEQGGQQNLNNSAALNLRGLGPDATLTLLNGHRLSYDALDQGVDISAIPLAAIERIEVVADGASALYGSDAVAGVANVILRRDYDALETRARVGGSTMCPRPISPAIRASRTRSISMECGCSRASPCRPCSGPEASSALAAATAISCGRSNGRSSVTGRRQGTSSSRATLTCSRPSPSARGGQSAP